ncbi:hypothetical protein C1886_26120, partial [Pseudomonas sp. FW300-N1A1]|uniref:hypothetical protein n=1 Tax=Pseudomonas sp. FW300-N1A1 TaxID=2075555 RepID=UPI000CD396FD
IQDGATFQFGWAPLLLRERAGDLVLCEPDFDDPSRGWRADVTTTLVVQADMMNVVRTYGAAPVASTYEQTLLVDVGAWTAPVVRMTRVRIDT